MQVSRTFRSTLALMSILHSFVKFPIVWFLSLPHWFFTSQNKVAKKTLQFVMSGIIIRFRKVQVSRTFTSSLALMSLSLHSFVKFPILVLDLSSLVLEVTLQVKIKFAFCFLRIHVVLP